MFILVPVKAVFKHESEKERESGEKQVVTEGGENTQREQKTGSIVCKRGNEN